MTNLYIPAQSDSPARRAKRRARRLRKIADGFLGLGKYAAVSLITLMVVVPDVSIASIVVAGNYVLVGIALGCGLRWYS